MLMCLARSPLNSKLSPVMQTGCLILKKLGTHLNRVVVVGLSSILRAVFRVPASNPFSTLRKINQSLIHLSFKGSPLITAFLY